MFNADGALNDTHAVRVGAAYNSVFAYVADGKNGFAVVQLISPGETVGAQGFSPIPTPRLIAHYKTAGPAIALSKGLDRDRAVDESGNQVSVFGRLGARPFTRPEMEHMFVRDGKIFTVAEGRPLLNGKPVGSEEVHPPVRAAAGAVRNARGRSGDAAARARAGAAAAGTAVRGGPACAGAPASRFAPGRRPCAACRHGPGATRLPTVEDLN